ncbi:hypothetical protein AMTR_s00023p00058970 [Amborella trichopoda]|uniref:Uncharacterized protein n=1 Tax=Amborella trichopoda TaxID=13333 RepID=W1NJZ5_AMBTC|nr:hypothetical protein AMTR_s00023p00058970 [Amborella trichopoda]
MHPIDISHATELVRENYNSRNCDIIGEALDMLKMYDPEVAGKKYLKNWSWMTRWMTTCQYGILLKQMRGQVIHNPSPHRLNQRSPDGSYVLVLQDRRRAAHNSQAAQI